MRSLIRGTCLTLVVLLFLGPLPARADTHLPDTPGGRAAAWLVAQATDGTWAQPIGDDTDWGLTTDAILGLAVIGAPEAELAPSVAALTAAVADGTYGFLSEPDHTDGGLLAKAAIIAVELGLDPHDFGGVDLVARVKAQVIDGRLDRGRPGANVFGQSYGLMALAAAGEDTTAMVDQLVAQQCPGGDFRLGLDDVACTTGLERADRDATAIAVTALRTAGSAPAAVERAVAWLVTDQGPDGAWTGSSFQPTTNTNSTALATRAVAGLAPAATTLAVGFTVSLQIAQGPDAGAVAYDAAALDAGAADGIDSSGFQWQRASAQALLALAHFNPATVDGSHEAHGRRWQTACSPTSNGLHCRAAIWAAVVHRGADGWAVATDWHTVGVTEVPARVS